MGPTGSRFAWQPNTLIIWQLNDHNTACAFGPEQGAGDGPHSLEVHLCACCKSEHRAFVIHGTYGTRNLTQTTSIRPSITTIVFSKSG